MSATERIVVQVTPQQKRSFARQAKSVGLNISEFMRRAAQNFRDAPEDAELAALLAKADQAAKESIVMIDDAIAFIEASNKRIARLGRVKSR